MFRCSCSGQGTISLELLEQVPQMDTIIAPISGLCQFLISSFFSLHFFFSSLIVCFFNSVNKQNLRGGLISGVALVAKSLNLAIRVIAAKPTGANDAAQSKAAGKIITLPETNTIADGLEAFLGDLTW